MGYSKDAAQTAEQGDESVMATWKIVDTRVRVGKKTRKVKGGFRSVSAAAYWIGMFLGKKDPKGVRAGRYGLDYERKE